MVIARLVLAAAVATTLVAGFAPTVRAQGTFAQTQVASGLNSPVGMAVAPDGRVFIAQQGGDVRVVENDVLLPTPFVTVPTTADDEEGLLAVAFDPAFATNHYVYVTYTAATPTRHNRIVRYTANGNVAMANSATTIFDLDDNVANYHIGGALHFGVDGKLYTTTGDNADSTNSPSLTTTHGKILRLEPTGAIPSDNPTFGGGTTGKYRAIFARGLRNAFSFDIQPGTGRIFVNDVGGGTWEEVNDVVAGANYGWPTTEGPDPPNLGGLTYPFHTYNHFNGQCAITGGTFYNPGSAQFPAAYVGKYFYGEYCTQTIRYIDPAGTPPVAATVLLSNVVAGPVDLRVAPNGALYYLARGNADPDGGTNINTGVLIRVTYSATGAPSISADPSPQTVAVGATATFSVSASGAPTLAYQWQRDNADIDGATASTYTTPATTLADDGAVFRCRVTNGNGTAVSNGATLTVVNGQPPIPVIATPMIGAHYDGGMALDFSGSATDPETGALGPDAFSWRIDFHHDDHTHPGLPLTTGVTSGTYAIPSIGEVSTNVFYRVILQVKDPSGLTATVTRDVLPNLGTITVDTDPSGLEVHVDTTEHLTPVAIPGVIGLTRLLRADSPQSIGGVPYAFTGWSDGLGSPHTILFPPAPLTYVAHFQPQAPLTIGKLSCAFRFDKTGRDKCNLKGVLKAVPAGFSPAGQTVTVDIGGARVGFTLDNRGHASVDNGSLVILVPSGFAGGDLKLRARFRNGTWASALDDEGVSPTATVKNQPLDVVVSVPVAGAEVHTATAAVAYKGIAGKRGRFTLR